MTEQKIIEGTIQKQLTSYNDHDLWIRIKDLGFYREEKKPGYALFREFEGKRVRITIEEIE